MPPYDIANKIGGRGVNKRRASVIVMKDIIETAIKYSIKPTKLPKLNEENKVQITKRKVKLYAELKEILQNKSALMKFRKFLKSEFSEENLDFWTECEAFKRTKESRLQRRAQDICDKYIQFGSPREVNLDGKLKKEIINNIENPTRDCFNDAQEKIFYLMESDSYQRFVSKLKINDEELTRENKSTFIRNMLNSGRRRLSV